MKYILLLTTVFVLIRCVDLDRRFVEKTGEHVSMDRPLTDFDAVAIYGFGNVFIHHGDLHSVTVEGDGGCVEHMETSVTRRTLEIKSKGMNFNGCGMVIHVTTPRLVSAVINGGGHIEVKEGFSKTDRVSFTINGGGKIDGQTITANEVEATINGGGKILVAAREVLDGEIIGGGSIRYQGSPQVDSNIIGGGQIRQF